MKQVYINLLTLSAAILSGAGAIFVCFFDLPKGVFSILVTYIVFVLGIIVWNEYLEIISKGKRRR